MFNWRKGRNYVGPDGQAFLLEINVDVVILHWKTKNGKNTTNKRTAGFL